LIPSSEVPYTPPGQSPDRSLKENGGAVRLLHTGKRKCRGPRLTSPPSVERWSKGERFVLTPFENGALISVIFQIIVHAKLILVVYFWFMLKFILFILSF